MAAWLAAKVSVTELCRQAGVSRKTAYKWRRRYLAQGAAGLVDQARTPKHSPQLLTPALVALLRAARLAHPTWGPRKLRAFLAARAPTQAWPAASTIGDCLKREGLVVPRQYRQRVPPYRAPFADCRAANGTWCTDFKGWVRTGDGQRCQPLTIIDAYSRYLLCCQHVDAADTEYVQALFTTCFRTHGMPWVIRSDNGPPFATCAPCGLSRLSVWWLKLGIQPERIAPASPQENGRLERLHLTLLQDRLSPPQATLAAQQRAFDHFRREYNEERPHEALDQRPPAQFYQSSSRAFPSHLPPITYPPGSTVRQVQAHGQFSWRNQEVFVTEALAGEPIGLRPLDERHYAVYFSTLHLGQFDSQTAIFHRLPTDRLAKRQRKR